MRISRIHWLVIATMVAHLLYALANLILSPVPELFPFYVIRFLGCIAFGILVSFGIGWARVLFAAFAVISTLTSFFGLCVYFANEGKYGQLGYHPDTSQVTTTLVLAVFHLPLLIWTIWLLAMSEDASDFFYERKHRHSN
jgi:hypothetical protein